jgi:hypothetical protein
VVGNEREEQRAVGRQVNVLVHPSWLSSAADESDTIRAAAIFDGTGPGEATSQLRIRREGAFSLQRRRKRGHRVSAVVRWLSASRSLPLTPSESPWRPLDQQSSPMSPSPGSDRCASTSDPVLSRSRSSVPGREGRRPTDEGEGGEAGLVRITMSIDHWGLWSGRLVRHDARMDGPALGVASTSRARGNCP